MGLAAGVILSSYDGTLVPKYMTKSNLPQPQPR